MERGRLSPGRRLSLGAMVAALTASLLEKQSLAETARNAICAGAFACTAESTIHPDMSKEAIKTLRKSEENML